MDVTVNNRADAVRLRQTNEIAANEIPLFLLTLLIWIDRILLTYIRAFMMRLPIVGFMADYFIVGTYAVLVALSLPAILKKMRMADFALVFGVAVTYLLNFTIFPKNITVLRENLPTFLFLTLPIYCIGLSLDFQKLYPWLYRLSVITIIAFTLYKLFVSAPMDDVQSMYAGDMWSAYNLLPHVCVVVLAMLRKTNIINLLASVVGVAMIASLGSRGPLLCVLVAAAVYLLLFKTYKRPILAGGVIITVSAVIILNIENIVLFMYDVAEKAGLSVRVFEKFLQGSFSDSSSRDSIARHLYTLIAQGPILGSGLFADRTAIGSYAHNIAIEMWLSFGTILGTAILGGIIAVLSRAAMTAKKHKEYALLFVPLLVSGFVKLFLSSSFLEEMYLFLLLGVCVRIWRDRKHSL